MIGVLWRDAAVKPAEVVDALADADGNEHSRSDYVAQAEELDRMGWQLVRRGEHVPWLQPGDLKLGEPLLRDWHDEATVHKLGSEGERMKLGQPGRQHDEAMRMQALAVGAQLAIEDIKVRSGVDECTDVVLRVARWAYREATGREW